MVFCDQFKQSCDINILSQKLNCQICSGKTKIEDENHKKYSRGNVQQIDTSNYMRNRQGFFVWGRLQCLQVKCSKGFAGRNFYFVSQTRTINIIFDALTNSFTFFKNLEIDNLHNICQNNVFRTFQINNIMQVKPFSFKNQTDPLTVG